MDDDCPFCVRIAAGEFDYSDRFAVAFEPLNPVTPGHLLVVPRKHVPDAGDDPLTAGRTMELAADIAGPLDLETPAYNLITSAGRAATQTVRHLHIHIVPRREGDGLALPWTGQQPLTGSSASS
jgi:histidine triad (HIT) family protein